MTDHFDVTNPQALLVAADQGAHLEQLDDDVERLVARALRERTWGTLTAASRVLRTIERFAREDRKPVPPRVTLLLGEVRSAMRERRGGRHD